MYFVMNQTGVTPDKSISYHLKNRHTSFCATGLQSKILANCVVPTKTFHLHVNNLKGKPVGDLGERPSPPPPPVLLMKTETEGPGTEVFRAIEAF